MPDAGPTLLLGATGLLGQALAREAARRGMQVVGVARQAPDGVSLDLTDAAALRALFERVQPRLVLNAAACTQLDLCERRPGEAHLVNTRLPGLLAQLCSAHGSRLVQISTDHYFPRQTNRLHDEASPVTLVNEYARGKYAAEALVATCPGSLTVRTNIVGFRRWPGQPTFAEWAVEALRAGLPFKAYADMWTSSIDVESFSVALLDLVGLGAEGVLNLAAREACSKLEFIHALADALGLDASCARPALLAAHPGTPRANALGLDVGRAERLLGRRLPGTFEVSRALARLHQAHPVHQDTTTHAA